MILEDFGQSSATVGTRLIGWAFGLDNSGTALVVEVDGGSQVGWTPGKYVILDGFADGLLDINLIEQSGTSLAVESVVSLHKIGGVEAHTVNFIARVKEISVFWPDCL